MFNYQLVEQYQKYTLIKGSNILPLIAVNKIEDNPYPYTYLSESFLLKQKFKLPANTTYVINLSEINTYTLSKLPVGNRYILVLDFAFSHKSIAYLKSLINSNLAKKIGIINALNLNLESCLLILETIDEEDSYSNTIINYVSALKLNCDMFCYVYNNHYTDFRQTNYKDLEKNNKVRLFIYHTSAYIKLQQTTKLINLHKNRFEDIDKERKSINNYKTITLQEDAYIYVGKYPWLNCLVTIYELLHS